MIIAWFCEIPRINIYIYVLIMVGLCACGVWYAIMGRLMRRLNFGEIRSRFDNIIYSCLLWWPCVSAANPPVGVDSLVGPTANWIDPLKPRSITGLNPEIVSPCDKSQQINLKMWNINRVLFGARTSSNQHTHSQAAHIRIA